MLIWSWFSSKPFQCSWTLVIEKLRWKVEIICVEKIKSRPKNIATIVVFYFKYLSIQFLWILWFFFSIVNKFKGLWAWSWIYVCCHERWCCSWAWTWSWFVLRSWAWIWFLELELELDCLKLEICWEICSVWSTSSLLLLVITSSIFSGLWRSLFIVVGGKSYD